MLRDHEKFWAFLALGLGVLLMVGLALIYGGDVKDPVLRIVDAATGGFLLALGSAANALFRVGTPADEQLKSAAAGAVQQTLPAGQPTPVTIEQPADQPVPVHEAPAQTNLPPAEPTQAEREANLPPMFREDAR